MEGRASAATADAATGQSSPDDTEQLIELAPEHLLRLQQLAASRAARQAGPPGAEPSPGRPAEDLVQENERLRTYVAALEAAVTVLLESAPSDTEPVEPAPG